MKNAVLYFFFLCIICPFCLWAQEERKVVRVAMEAAPGLVEINGKGILNKILKELEKKHGFKFERMYMTYGRAKKELEKGRVDMVVFTPCGEEIQDFYQYAADLDWSFNTHNLIFLRDKNIEGFEGLKTIGTQPGNEEFMASLYGISTDRFHGGPLESLFRMLEKGRLDAVIFEGISSLTTLERLKIKGFSVKILTIIKATFSVRRDNPQLKRKLDQALRKIDTQSLFQSKNEFQILKHVRKFPNKTAIKTKE